MGNRGGRLIRVSRKTGWFSGKRRRSGMNEFCRLRRNERYGACADESARKGGIAT
nr:MAG TPA: hypothetical protein [Caudoviricetes sp.]